MDSQPERAARNLSVIEACGAVQFADDRRQLQTRPPLIGASASVFDRLLPDPPPGRDESGQRLHHQHAAASLPMREETIEQRVTRAVVELVHDKRGEHMAAGWRRYLPDIARAGTALELEMAIGPPCLLRHPGMSIDPVNFQALGGRRRPCCSSCAC